MFPGGRRYLDCLFIGFRDDQVVNQADLGLLAMGGEGTQTLVLFPYLLVPLHVGLESVQVSHDNGMHSGDR